MRLLECLKSAGKVLHGNSCLWSMMKKSSKGLRILRFCVMSWEDESEPAIQHFGHNRRRYDGKSSGIFSQDSLHWSLSVKSQSS